MGFGLGYFSIQIGMAQWGLDWDISHYRSVWLNGFWIGIFQVLLTPDNSLKPELNRFQMYTSVVAKHFVVE